MITITTMEIGAQMVIQQAQNQCCASAGIIGPASFALAQYQANTGSTSRMYLLGLVVEYMHNHQPI